MKRAEREALLKRMDSKGWRLFAGTAADQLLGYIAWEIDRERRRANAECKRCLGLKTKGTR